MKYTIYDPATGEIQCVLDSADPQQIQANLADQSYIEGVYDNTYRVVAGQAVKKPADPSTALAPHVFDYSTGQWTLDLDRAARQSRQHRDSRLTEIDRVNPIWYATLTAEQQDQLITYRQALLTVPEQSGFPIHVSWPAKPTWL